MYCEYDGWIHPFARRSSICLFASSNSVWLNLYCLWFGIGRFGSSSSILCWIARGNGVAGGSNTSGNSFKIVSHFVGVECLLWVSVWLCWFVWLCVGVCVLVDVVAIGVVVVVAVTFACCVAYAHSVAGEYSVCGAGWPAPMHSAASTASTASMRIANNLR